MLKVIPGQMIESSISIPYTDYSDLAQRIKQEKKADTKTKRVVRKVLKTFGSLSALAGAIYGISLLKKSLTSIKEPVSRIQATARSSYWPTYPPESRDKEMARRYLNVDRVTAVKIRKSMRTYHDINRSLKLNERLTGTRFIAVPRGDLEKLGYVRLALKEFYGGYEISFNPGRKAYYLCPKGEELPQPKEHDVTRFMGIISRNKEYADKVFKMHPSLKKTHIYRDFEMIWELYEEAKKRRGDLKEFSMTLAKLEDQIELTAKHSDDFYAFLTEVKKDAENNARTRQRVLGSSGIQEVPTTEEGIRKMQPPVLKSKMMQLKTLLDRWDDPESKKLARLIDLDYESIKMSELTPEKFLHAVPYNPKLIGRYASNLSKVKQHVYRKLPPVRNESVGNKFVGTMQLFIENVEEKERFVLL